MNDALNARQNNMTQLNDHYKALVSEGDRCNLSVPSQLQQQVAALNADWESIQRLAAELSHMPLDVSMEDMASKQGRLCRFKHCVWIILILSVWSAVDQR